MVGSGWKADRQQRACYVQYGRTWGGEMSGAEILARLKAAHPRIDFILTGFPSGSFMIDFAALKQPYAIEYVAGGTELGLSSVKNAVFGWEGCEYIFQSVDELNKKILELTAS